MPFIPDRDPEFPKVIPYRRGHNDGTNKASNQRGWGYDYLHYTITAYRTAHAVGGSAQYRPQGGACRRIGGSGGNCTLWHVYGPTRGNYTAHAAHVGGERHVRGEQGGARHEG